MNCCTTTTATATTTTLLRLSPRTETLEKPKEPEGAEELYPELHPESYPKQEALR